MVSPKPRMRVLPSLTNDQIGYLISFVSSIRDKAIISLLADSGVRLSELASRNIELTLFRIAQEALRNVEMHAEPQKWWPR